MVQTLHTIGEVIDNLKHGEYAVSVVSDDAGTFLFYDEQNWMMVIYPHHEYKKYAINIQRLKDGKLTRRFVISEMNDDIRDWFSSINYAD